jgi:hypothetical protein
VVLTVERVCLCALPPPVCAQLLEGEFAAGLHALSLSTRTPAEAEKVAA